MSGLFFEDFEVGKIYDHEVARSVTQFDNIWYSCMTLNTQPLHSNIDFSTKIGTHKRPLFNSMYSLSIVIGQTSTDLTHGTLIKNILLDDIQFPNSVFADDTLYSRTTILAVRPSDEDPHGGVVELLHEGRNQDQMIVVSCKRTVLVRRNQRHS